jgi:hypothetical protein
MASTVLIDAKLLVAGYDMSGHMNALALDYSADMLDATTFGNTTRIHQGGLKSVVGQHEGFWDASTATAPDPVIFARIGTADMPVTIAPTTGAAGALAYMFNAVHSTYNTGGTVGDLMSFSVSMEGSGGQPLVRGTVLHNGSASGNVTGTGYELGAVGAAQYLYGTLHVFSGTGSFVVKIQSSDDDEFSDPIDRITFATVETGTPIAAQWAARVSGAITDTWWRVVAVNPNTRNFAAVAGIL